MAIFTDGLIYSAIGSAADEPDNVISVPDADFARIGPHGRPS